MDAVREGLKLFEGPSEILLGLQKDMHFLKTAETERPYRVGIKLLEDSQLATGQFRESCLTSARLEFLKAAGGVPARIARNEISAHLPAIKASAMRVRARIS